MDINNYFIVPPPQTHRGDYSFSSSIQYGSSHHLQWTDTYNIPLDLVLVQETAFFDDNTIPVNLDTLEGTVPSLPLPVDPRGGS